jgi:aspartyl-tRNA(Asn)/glutamyl-tRNA(Gln) amidotransferase subunit A
MTPNTVVAARAAMQRGQTSSTALVEAALEQAAKLSECNLFAHLDAERALEQAKRADANPSPNPLHGIPVTVKDLYNVAGMPTKGGTHAALPAEFQNPQSTAQAVLHLEAAGAIVLGKVNMHEIALGITGENLATGDVKNPLEPSRQTGGSSSGSAAAVAVGAGLGSLGSDTGGSVRIPASFCGVVGFKPSLGLVPLAGALHLSMTCDHAGTLTRTVQDAHIMLEVLAHRNFALRHLDNLRGLRLGVPRAWLEGRLGTSVRRDFEALLERLRQAGAEVQDVVIEHFEFANQCYTPLVRAEAAFVHRGALANHPEGFSEMVRPALQDGAQISASRYLAARAERRLVRSGLENALRQVDALVLPAAPMAAPMRGTQEVLLESGMRPHRNAFIELTVPFSLVGVPTLSLPFAKESGLPVGLQIVTAKGEDALALELGWWLEKALE